MATGSGGKTADDPIVVTSAAHRDMREVFGRDWRPVDGEAIYASTRMRPLDVVGVRAMPGGQSFRKPWPYDCHRTHFPLLGLTWESTPVTDKVPKILRPYQSESWRFMRERRGTLLADEQRVGKTVPTLYVHDDADRDPFFVLGPLASRGVWHEWAAKRWGGCVAQLEWQRTKRGRGCAICNKVGVSATDVPSFMVCEGRTFDVERVLKYRPRALFATYAVASTWRALYTFLSRIGTLVFDEIHLAGIQNRNNVTITSLRWLNTIAERTIALTGTPLFNRVQGLWSIFDLVAPAAFGDFWSFARRYCAAKPGAHGWQATGESNQEELRKRMSEIMLRRRWTDIREDLPPITRTLELITLPPAVKDRVEAEAARIRYETRSQKTFVGDLARLRKMYAREKVAGSLKIVDGILADGHSVVLWAWHKETAAQLAEKLNGGGVPMWGPLTGETSPAARERMLAEVATDTRPRVLVASIAALSTAVSLAWASHEVFCEFSWNPSDIAQAEMRPYDGSRPIAAIYVAADVDSDERMALALIRKLEAQGALGLRAGVGDVADILADSLDIERGRSLDDLAAAVLETLKDYV